MWAAYAILAAILWGLDYSLTEKVLHEMRLPTLLCIELFCGSILMLVLALLTGTFKTDIAHLLSSRRTLLLVVVIVTAFNIANVLIVLAIGSKSATLSGLVEISYPLFIALFSWILFGENHFDLGTVMGGILIFAGVALISFLNQ